ncbi:zinc ribbon domain-containing protein [Janthinobacterium sp.]|uniref:zinc ribbon domain-containing protein n=1 Tax=Janthinobacterium sp. TaxID=1871054 RepID=UPI00293D1E1C|nr:zinc ribbon domain-containing protein [Janthinobacterium sp.]
MALLACKKCGKECAADARFCPACGKPTRQPKRTVAIVVIIIASVIALAVTTRDETPPQPLPSEAQKAEVKASLPAPPQQAEPPQPKESPVNFDLPLQTMRGTLVCPLSAIWDKREGHGLQAAVKSRVEIFGRQESAEKAGCQEWQEGLLIQLSDEERQRAKKWQVDHSCGMLTFDEGLIFSCQLHNNSDKKIHPQNDQTKNKNSVVRLKWDAPATLSGILKSSMFENCCINGEVSKGKYFFLHLDSKFNIESGGEDESAIAGVEAIQLGGAFPGLNDGQHIVVACKQIWQGNTGHYALPVYCNEPKVQ